MNFVETVIAWYSAHMNYASITALMTIESSFIPFPSEVVIPPAAFVAAEADSALCVTANYPVDVDRLTQDEKMEIMDILNRKGVFLLKGSVSYVAKELHSSEASIYRYLGKLNSKSEL